VCGIEIFYTTSINGALLALQMKLYLFIDLTCQTPIL